MHTFNFGNYIPHNTKVHLHLYKNEKDEYGEFVDLYDGDVFCNFQSKSQKMVNGNTLINSNTTTILVFDDIEPNHDILNSGYVEYMQEKRTIKTGQKARDIYGKFQFWQFELD